MEKKKKAILAYKENVKKEDTMYMAATISFVYTLSLDTGTIGIRFTRDFLAFFIPQELYISMFVGQFLPNY